MHTSLFKPLSINWSVLNGRLLDGDAESTEPLLALKSHAEQAGCDKSITSNYIHSGRNS